MLSIIKISKLIILKIFNKCNNCLPLFIIVSITCHVILVFFFSLNNDVELIKNNNNIVRNISYIKASMVNYDTNPITVNDNDTKVYKIPIAGRKKNKEPSVKNDTRNLLQIKKNKNFDHKNIKKSLINNTIKKTHGSQEIIKFNDLISKLANNKCIYDNSKILKNNDNILLKNSMENIILNDIENFKNKIHQAVSDKFYNYSNYIGQNCDINIQIGLNGELISLVATKGDIGLCQAALSATKLAILPKPPNNYIYDIFKNTTLKFSPR